MKIAPIRCPRPPSVMVYHPERILAEAIAATLRRSGLVSEVGAVDRIDDIVTVRQAVPALIVMASRTSGEIGDMAETLMHRNMTIPILSCRDIIDADGVTQDLLQGASGVAALASTSQQFVAIAKALLAGEIVIPADVRTCVLRTLAWCAAEQAEAHDRLARMTPRQRQVLDLLAKGHRQREIAARLGVSPNTARTHADHVRAKLSATSQLEAVVEARRTLALATGPARPIEAICSALCKQG